MSPDELTAVDYETDFIAVDGNPSTRHLSPKVRAFIDHLVTSGEPHPWEPLDTA